MSQPAAIHIVQGDDQNAGPNTKLPTDLGVVVVTQFGEPVPGVPVQWSVASGGGTVDPVLTQTNENGIATASYTTGAATGPAKVRAKAGDLPVVTFTVSITQPGA